MNHSIVRGAAASGPRARRHTSRLGAVVALLIAALLTIITSVAAGGIALASQSAEAGSRTLLAALQDPTVQDIVVLPPLYNVRSEFESHQGKPLVLSRNVTITGAQGLDTVLNLDFVAAAVQLCPACSVTFHNITVTNERHGVGEAVDFIAGQPGSGSSSSAAVLFVGANKLRLACTDAAVAAAVLQEAPRSSGAKQQATLQDATFQDTPFPGSLHLAAVSTAVPYETVEGWRAGLGGYTVINRNATRLCRSVVDAACVAKSTPAACVVDAIDEVRAAAQSGSHTAGAGSNPFAIAGAVVAGAVCIAAIIAGTFCWSRKRRLHQQQQQQQQHQHKRPPGTSLGSKPQDSLPSGGVASSGCDEELGEAAGVDVEALRMFDSFIEGCNFVRQPLGVRKGWELSKVMSSPFIESMPAEDKNIQLGQFCGAGSFGRVYKARWGGRDVAVKVIEHNSDASNAVESEVELMFKFSNHPNIVRAFYAITYTQNGLPSVPLGANTTGSTSSNNIQRDSCTNNTPSSGGSSSNRVGVIGSGSGQRLVLAQLRNIPLQEVVVEGESPMAHSAAAKAAAGAAAGSAAAGVCTPDAWEVGNVSSRHRPLERIDSDTEQQQQQQDQAASMSAAPAKLTAQAVRQVSPFAVGDGSDTAADRVERSAGGLTGSNLGSNLGVRGSYLGSTDCVSRVYSWMGGSAAAAGGQQLQGVVGYTWSAAAGNANGNGSGAAGCRRPVEAGGVPVREKRAETWLVQEYCDVGTLGSVASEWKPADESDERMLQRLLLLKDAAHGLTLLHSMHTVHGDLTARNVLVCSSQDAQFGMVAKLADLGLSRVIKQQCTHRTTNTVGTLSHMPPELLRYGHCSTAVDIYAFGVMMWELYTNKAAFNKLQYGQFYEHVVLRNLRPLLPAGMPADYSLLMQHCWASDPASRPNVDRVLHCLGLMIAERQERLHEPTVASRVQSAPLPQLQMPCSYRLPHGAAPAAATAAAAYHMGMFSARPDGTVRHASCPGPSSSRGPYCGSAAAAASAVAAAAAAARGYYDGNDEDDDDDEMRPAWKEPSVRFSSMSWGDRSSIVCNTPSVPLRPLRKYSSEDYGTGLTQEEYWVV